MELATSWLGVGGRTIDTIDLKGIGVNMRNSCESAKDRDYSRALVNATLNVGFHKTM